MLFLYTPKHLDCVYICTNIYTYYTYDFLIYLCVHIYIYVFLHTILTILTVNIEGFFLFETF